MFLVNNGDDDAEERIPGFCINPIGFGVLNNGPKDVPLEDFHGYKLDSKILDLL